MSSNRGKLAKQQRAKKSFWLIIILSAVLIVFFVLVICLKPRVVRIIQQFSFSEPVLKIAAPFTGQLYFNDQLGQNKLSEIVVKAIDESSQTIELAVYSFDDQDIRDALYRAAARGVKVKLVLSTERQNVHDQLFKNLPDNIQRFDIDSNQGYMHHKFLLVDRGKASGQLLFGSYNFTNLQDKYDPSFLLVSQRAELIDTFGQEIDRLLGGQNSRNKLVNNDRLVNRFEYQDGFLEIWFGPQKHSNGLKERMIGLISGTENNLKAMIWNFTDKEVARAMLKVARHKPVNLLVDDSNWFGEYSVKNIIPGLRFDKLEIVTDAKRNQEVRQLSGQDDLNSFLHHHALLIDDRTVIFGTNNWSSGGFFDNDESTIVSDIDSLVQSFEQSFLFNYQKNQ